MATVNHVRPGSPSTEVVRLGPLTIRILSSNAQTSSVILTISPKTPAFPVLYHEKHQVSFLILRGNTRFITSVAPSTGFSAKGGEFVDIPAGASYGFGNPYSKETEMLVTYAPGSYVECLREMGRLYGGGKTLSGEELRGLFGQWSTVIIGEGGSPGQGSANEDEDEDDEDSAPRYTGLRCMA
jgi:hypothetical protein